MKELTDLEICKRIAEIEGAFNTQDDGINLIAFFKVGSGGCEYSAQHHGYNPLKDDALCFKLMVKYDITFFNGVGFDGNIPHDLYICQHDKLEDMIHDKSPNKAICLSIIEAHKPR